MERLPHMTLSWKKNAALHNLRVTNFCLLGTLLAVNLEDSKGNLLPEASLTIRPLRRLDLLTANYALLYAHADSIPFPTSIRYVCGQGVQPDNSVRLY